MRMLAIASLAVIAATSAQAAPAAGAGGLAAHRAVYDLSLKDASERSGISGMVGRMVYEFAGSACEGYTVSFRFVTEISTGEDSRLTDQQTTTFEDIRKGTFRFVTRSFVDQKLDHEVRGSAEVKEDGLAVALEQPDKLSLDIAPARFPTEHMIELIDNSGSNIGVQIFDTAAIDPKTVSSELDFSPARVPDQAPVILVMDYAFGEQAYESMDELLRPYHVPGQDKVYDMPVESINIMGKAGILEGIKGDLMIPNAHIFEGTADNYPFKNTFTGAQFEGNGLGVYTGPMVTVLGTSLQNREILEYFLESSWAAAGLEMEGAHYQKAIQAATHIRKSVNPELKLRYAYYASDNPLVTGHTLASGSLGVDGVKPTYLITVEILKGIFAG